MVKIVASSYDVYLGVNDNCVTFVYSEILRGRWFLFADNSGQLLYEPHLSEYDSPDSWTHGTYLGGNMYYYLTDAFPDRNNTY